PLVPRTQVHHRFREKHADVGIFRKLLPHFAHGIGISAIERTAVFRLRIRVTLAERFDHRALDWRSFGSVYFGKRKFFPSQLRSGGGTTVKLMCGPLASAIPQCAMAHLGSSSAAC